MKTSAMVTARKCGGHAPTLDLLRNKTSLGSVARQPPAEERRPDRRSQFQGDRLGRFWWAAALVVVGLLLVANLTATFTNHRSSPSDNTYSSRVAERDHKLSTALAKELRAAGFSFDAVFANVDSPACNQALCLIKFLRRETDNSARTIAGGVSAGHAGRGIWTFTGTGELIGFSFSLDASAEMRRLAEAAPPEFALPLGTAAVINQPLVDSASAFRMEREYVFPSADTSARPLWLDLETGRCLIDPDRDYIAGGSAVLSEWVRRHGLDVYATVDRDGSFCLYPRYMAVAQVDGKLWQQASLEEIASHPALQSMARPYGRALLFKDRAEGTYLFRTKDGTSGILQVQRTEDSLPELRIRWKLASNKF